MAETPSLNQDPLPTVDADSRSVPVSDRAEAVGGGGAQELVLGNYVLLEKLGEGGMGQVYKARHRRLDRVVAIKTLRSELDCSREAISRFQREVRAAARLSHPNIVVAYDANESGGIPFLVMEYVDGQDLSSLVRGQGPLSVATAVDYLLQAARGLEYAHRQGVLHRDIKPSNLIVDRSGTLRILDMGLARIEATESGGDSSLTDSGQLLGTVDYLSPEQALDARQVDARADIYSLGCTLHYLLLGKPPYEGDTAAKLILAHREQDIPSLRASRPDVPDWLDALFQSMLAKEPEGRPQTMGEVIAALQTHAAVGTAAHHPSSPPVMSRRSLGQRWIGMSKAIRTILIGGTLGGALAVALAVLTVILYERNRLELTAEKTRNPTPPADKSDLSPGAPTTPLSNPGAMPPARPLGPSPPSASVSPCPPLAVAPFDAAQAKRHQEAWAQYLGLPVELTNSIGMRFVLVPPGEFYMGSTKADFAKLVEQGTSTAMKHPDWNIRLLLRIEGPRHLVRITKPFYLGVSEVTQAEYERVTGTNPSKFKDDPIRPVEMVNWGDASTFCRKLGDLPQEQAAHAGYRLPTEAEWEYACRAGTTTNWYFGDDAAALKDYAWFSANAGRATHPVCQKESSPWGLCDMHGNVWEWCQDWHRDGYFATSPIDDPTGAPEGGSRVNRGGSWYYDASRCRAAHRCWYAPSFRCNLVGFRLARTVTVP